MNQAIANLINKLAKETKGSLEDIKLVTEKEFEREGYTGKHSYFIYLSNLTVDKVKEFLNFLYVSREFRYL